MRSNSGRCRRRASVLTSLLFALTASLAVSASPSPDKHEPPLLARFPYHNGKRLPVFKRQNVQNVGDLVNGATIAISRASNAAAISTLDAGQAGSTESLHTAPAAAGAAEVKDALGRQALILPSGVVVNAGGPVGLTQLFSAVNSSVSATVSAGLFTPASTPPTAASASTNSSGLFTPVTSPTAAAAPAVPAVNATSAAVTSSNSTATVLAPSRNTTASTAVNVTSSTTAITSNGVLLTASPSVAIVTASSVVVVIQEDGLTTTQTSAVQSTSTNWIFVTASPSSGTTTASQVRPTETVVQVNVAAAQAASQNDASVKTSSARHTFAGRVFGLASLGVVASLAVIVSAWVVV